MSHTHPIKFLNQALAGFPPGTWVLRICLPGYEAGSELISVSADGLDIRPKVTNVDQVLPNVP